MLFRSARSVWLNNAFEDIRQHLGLIFHRFISDGRVELSLDQYASDLGVPGAKRAIDAIDPVGYVAVGIAPIELRADVDGTPLIATGHVWPAMQTNAAQYRLYGKPGEEATGLFVYRNDRLLQAGGWNTVVNDDSDLALARVVIELDDTAAKHATINPEKAGVEFDATLRDALAKAKASDGQNFTTYLAACRKAAQISRKRNPRPILVAEPGRGLSNELARLINELAEPVPGGTVDIRWRSALDNQLIEIDIDERTIWLNTKYRSTISSDDGDPSDAPLVKTLILVLYSKFFEGTMLGSREREEVKVWDELLKAALEIQRTMKESDG